MATLTPSPAAADWWFSIFNGLLVVGLVLTAAATVGAIWMANVREGYLKRDLAEATARVEEARAQAEAAHERTAKLAKETEALRNENLKLAAKVMEKAFLHDRTGDAAGDYTDASEPYPTAAIVAYVADAIGQADARKVVAKTVATNLRYMGTRHKAVIKSGYREAARWAIL